MNFRPGVEQLEEKNNPTTFNPTNPFGDGSSFGEAQGYLLGQGRDLFDVYFANRPGLGPRVIIVDESGPIGGKTTTVNVDLPGYSGPVTEQLGAGAEIGSFFVFDPDTRHGLQAVVTADGTISFAGGVGDGPVVVDVKYNSTTNTLEQTARFFVGDSNYRGGIELTTGDAKPPFGGPVNNDLLVSFDRGGPPVIEAFDPAGNRVGVLVVGNPQNRDGGYRPEPAAEGEYNGEWIQGVINPDGHITTWDWSTSQQVTVVV